LIGRRFAYLGAIPRHPRYRKTTARAISAPVGMPAVPRRRPWYLALAVLGAIGLGATGACDGWRMVALYHEPIDASFATQRISDASDRAAIVAQSQHYLQVLDAAKSRGWPFAVAALVLGMAMVVASVRTLRGSNVARLALIQLVIAQAAVHVIGYLVLRDVFFADDGLDQDVFAAQLRIEGADRPRSDELAAKAIRVRRGIVRGVSSVGSLLIVFALTRKRAREHLDSANTAVGER